MRSYHLWLAASILASFGGIAAYLLLFFKDMNIYWLILSPIIIALYQAPAVLLFRFYKRYRQKAQKEQDKSP